MFEHGFPSHWTFLDKLIWLRAVAASAAGIWKTVTGILIHITDALASPVQTCEITLEPIQAGSGDPSPTNVRPITGWTGANAYVTGVNVWDEEYVPGTLNSNGTVTEGGNTRIVTKNYIPVLPLQTYMVVGSYTPTSFDGRGAFYDKDYNLVSYTSTFPSANMMNDVPNNLKYGTFTVPDGAYYLKFCTHPNYGGVYNHDISINYPSTDHDYHAYSGTTASVTFHALIENLYTSEVERGNIDSSGADASSETRCRSKDLIPVEPNTQYTFSYGLNVSGTPVCRIVGYGQNGSYVSDIAENGSIPCTFTTGEDIYYIRTVMRTSANNAILASYIQNTQLELGSNASPYGLFDNALYYAQYNFVTGDGIATHMKVVADGAITGLGAPSSSYNGNIGTVRRFGVAKVASGLLKIESDVFKGVRETIWQQTDTTLWNATLYDKSIFMDFENSVVGIETSDNTATRTTKIREWLKNNPATFIVPLADPIPFHIDPQQISTLAGENNVWGSGNIELTYKAQAE